MSQLFAAFGIDWRLLLVNFINFGLLLFLLWYFLYGPLTRMLEERRQKVAKGVHDADEAARQLRAVEDSRAGMLAKAGKEADDVLAAARASATQKEREIVASADAAARSLMSEAELRAAEMKSEAIEESKQEVAKLIVLGIEKTLRQNSALQK